MTRGKLYEFSPSFLHIYCWYTSNHTLFPSTATNAAQSERRVIQFPLCIIVIIGRYQNASQACYKSSHYFILKNSSISIWTSKQGCIHGGLSQARVGNGGNNWHVLSFSQFNTSFQLTCALMGYSFIFPSTRSSWSPLRGRTLAPLWWQKQTLSCLRFHWLVNFCCSSSIRRWLPPGSRIFTVFKRHYSFTLPTEWEQKNPPSSLASHHHLEIIPWRRRLWWGGGGGTRRVRSNNSFKLFLWQISWNKC